MGTSNYMHNSICQLYVKAYNATYNSTNWRTVLPIVSKTESEIVITTMKLGVSYSGSLVNELVKVVKIHHE